MGDLTTTITFTDPALGTEFTLHMTLNPAMVEHQISNIVSLLEGPLSDESLKEIRDDWVNRVLANTPHEIYVELDTLCAKRFHELAENIASDAGVKLEIMPGRYNVRSTVDRGHVRRQIINKAGAPAQWPESTLQRAIASAACTARRLEWRELARIIGDQYPERPKPTAGSLRLLVLRRLGLSLADLKGIKKRTQSRRGFRQELLQIAQTKADTSGQKYIENGIKRATQIEKGSKLA
jgi:hypothetical protein